MPMAKMGCRWMPYELLTLRFSALWNGLDLAKKKESIARLKAR
jgi:hypothetical protein